MRKKILTVLMIAAAILLAGCQGNVQTSPPMPTDIPTGITTPEPTPTDVPTPEPTPTDMPTPTPTDAPTPTNAPTPTPTDVPTPEPTPTDVPTPEPTPTDVPTPTPTDTPTPTPTDAPTPTPMPTNTPVPTLTNTPVTGSGTGKVIYITDSVQTESGRPTWQESTEEAYQRFFDMVMKYKGMISTTTTTMTSADMYMVAEQIAALPGIAGVTVTELNRYSEASKFEVEIACQKAFSYLYAIGTGDESVLSAQEKQAFDIAKDVAGQAEKYATDFEKEVFFHDYLVLNIAYDMSDSVGTGQTPYGALVLGKCVCAGYASTMQVLLTLAGIECMEVSGTGNGGAHAWNKVKIDGDWYNVDVTWDDPVPDEKGRLQHTYLNVTDEFLKRDHSWDNTGFPSCMSTEYNYYLRTKQQCANQDEVNKYCKEQVEAGNWIVSFIYQNAQLDVSDVCQSVGKGCSYTYKECEGGIWYEITFQ